MKEASGIMIIDYKRIDLFGKMLFEKAVIRPPFKKANPMPDEACFLHIREGSYHSISEEAFLGINTGQSVLMKCGNYLSRMIGDEETGMYEAVAVHFHPDVLKKIYAQDLPSFLSRKNLQPPSGMALVEATIPIEKYIEDILFYFEHPHLANEDILILKTREIILLLMQTPEAPNILQILENLFSERTVDFKTIIEAHMFSDLSLLEFAQLCNMSLSSFKRTFKSVYQSSPVAYLQQRRLAKSKELLSISDQSIGEIAFDCCFKNASHFSKKFKQHYGMSPSEFRLSLSA